MREIVGRQRNYAEIINQAALNISRADSCRQGRELIEGFSFTPSNVLLLQRGVEADWGPDLRPGPRGRGEAGQGTRARHVQRGLGGRARGQVRLAGDYM